MIDATAPFEKQDPDITDLIAREGRAVVFAINKWTCWENKAGAISRMREKLDQSLPQVAGAPLVATSARTGEGIDRWKPPSPKPTGRGTPECPPPPSIASWKRRCSATPRLPFQAAGCASAT